LKPVAAWFLTGCLVLLALARLPPGFYRGLAKQSAFAGAVFSNRRMSLKEAKVS